MKPLSAFKYYKHNKKKFSLVVVPVFLSIVLLYFIQMLITSYFQWEYDSFVETRKYYTSIQVMGNPIDFNMIKEIENNENTEKVIPCIMHFTNLDTFIDQIGIRVYTMHVEDMKELMENMGLKLTEGRLPDNSESEIIIHRALALNKNLEIGDKIGNHIDTDESLIGQYEIVGIIAGKPLACFSSLEFWKKEHGINIPHKYGILVYPKPGKLAQLNQYIRYLPHTGNYISSYSTSTNELNQTKGKINLILNTIYISIILIVSICIGFLTYLFYMNKAREFAILNVIGYSKQFIIKSNLIVIGAVKLIVTIAGIAAAIMIGLLFNTFIFYRLGTPLVLITRQALLPCLCIPLLSITAEILSICMVFGKLDPVSIIELENG